MALSTDQLKKYWGSANALRENLDAAEYKHIVLGLVFLKYVSDAFSQRQEELAVAFSDPTSDRYKPDNQRLQAALKDRNYYHEASGLLGQVYEYFLGKFAAAEGKLGGQLYTTPSIVNTLVEILQPTKGIQLRDQIHRAPGGRYFGREINPRPRPLRLTRRPCPPPMPRDAAMRTAVLPVRAKGDVMPSG